MRQGANSAVRFTTYVTLKQFVQGTARPGQPLPSAITFGIGGIAGLVTVYTTMPLECVLFSSILVLSTRFSVIDSGFSVLSRPACRLWTPERNTEILSIARIGFLQRRVYVGSGRVRRRG